MASENHRHSQMFWIPSSGQKWPKLLSIQSTQLHVGFLIWQMQDTTSPPLSHDLVLKEIQTEGIHSSKISPKANWFSSGGIGGQSMHPGFQRTPSAFLSDCSLGADSKGDILVKHELVHLL